MPQNQTLQDDEIDLRELFATLWAHKLLITLFTGLSIFLAAQYILTTEKKFTVSAIFQIEQNDSSPRFNLPSEFGALASIAGLASGIGASGTDILLERATGREFIIDMKKSFFLSVTLTSIPMTQTTKILFGKRRSRN